MPINEAWDLLHKAMEATKPGCMVVLSPRIVLRLLEERLIEKAKEAAHAEG